MSNRRTFLLLEALLKEECSLYREYRKILELEVNSVTELEVERVADLTVQRQILSDRMQEVNEKRKELLSGFEAGDKTKLSEIIVKSCSRVDAARILPLVKTLRSEIEECQRFGSEFSQVLSFSQRLIDGTVSILRSASQSVNRLYTKAGKVQESFVPASSRVSSALRQA